MANGDRLQFDGKTYLSAKVAGEYSGYTSDYLARLCREGSVLGRMVGRAWYVEEDSFFRFLAATNKKKLAGKQTLSVLRRREYENKEDDTPKFVPYEAVQKVGALLAAALFIVGAYAFLPSFFGFENAALLSDTAERIVVRPALIGKNLAAAAGDSVLNIGLDFDAFMDKGARSAYALLSTFRKLVFLRFIEPFCPR